MVKSSLDRANKGRWPMHTFTLRTAGCKVIIEETTPWKACIAAAKAHKLKAIGMLIQIDRKGGETSFCSGERVAKAAGIWPR